MIRKRMGKTTKLNKSKKDVLQFYSFRSIEVYSFRKYNTKTIFIRIKYDNNHIKTDNKRKSKNDFYLANCYH